MDNFRYKLISPKNIEKVFSIEEITDKDIIIKPEYMSICSADQRYYFGLRSPNVLKNKLPLALIHECIGIVVDNNNNSNYKIGDKVVLYPNIIQPHYSLENYDLNSKFMSSTIDGFMQELVVINESNILKIDDNFKNYNIMVLTELLSVIIHAVDSIDEKINNVKTISLWGDGNLSYLCHLYIAFKYPNKKMIIYGVNEDKLLLFSNDAIRINILNENSVLLPSDICIEMVGGDKSEKVIEDIIKSINPTGTILLLGVSENKIKIETRMILEKGITLVGRSRSPKSAFSKAMNFIYSNYDKVSKIISETIVINNIDDINRSFEKSIVNRYKTIMKWEI